MVAKAHRRVDLSDNIEYPVKYFVKNGSEFVNLPYLGCLLRIGDELDITDKRISYLVLKYYYPENKESQFEIEKHKANILINFDFDTIIITAQCKNEYIYNTLTYLYNKIEKKLNLCQKIIRNIRFVGIKEYLLSINKIKKEIKTKNFIPKNIGFSLDINNIFQIFISKTLYSDKYIAIREVLQNAIDTCRYKKALNPDYNPKIIIILENNKLIIKDNGLGMDEFIIQEYFTKIGESYYQIKEIKNVYDSIASFGIGIFSFFLISKYFEVNTKMKNNPPLRFRVNKGINFNVHFYDSDLRNEDGTDVILYLEDELKNELTIDKLLESLKYYLKDIEIPIEIKQDSTNISLKFQNKYELDSDKELSKFLKTSHLDKKNQLILINKKIESDKFRGIIGVVLRVDKSGKLIIDRLHDWRNLLYLNSVQILYKGIYVNNYWQLISNSHGIINILSKEELNLNRDNFVKSKLITNILTIFNAELISEISKMWEYFLPEEKYIKSNSFLKYYINVRSSLLRCNELTVSLKRSIYIKIYKEDNYVYLNLKDFVSNNKKFILFCISNISEISKNEKENLNTIFTQNILSIMIIPINLLTNYIYILTDDKLDLELKKVSDWEYPFLILKQDERSKNRTFLGDIECIEFENDVQIFNTFSFYKKYFNIKHPIVKFLIRLNSDIKVKKEEKFRDVYDLYLEFLEFFKFFSPNFNKFPIKKVNNVLEKLNKNFEENFFLKEEDFPKWINLIK